ncbi:hypothetical protein BH20CHL6_BH20CHL6_08390 [soil metagenome]
MGRYEGFEGFTALPAESLAELTLYTDSHVVRGQLRTRKRRLSDVLNETDSTFLVLENVSFEEFGTHALIERAPYAQINLAAVLFAVSMEAMPAAPEFRVVKISEQALISVPPFRIVGRIHLLPGMELREALGRLQSRFLPITNVTYWSERLDESRTEAPMLAFNQARAQIMAPYSGNAGSGNAGWTSDRSEAAEEPAEPRPETAPDPWRDLPR